MNEVIVSMNHISKSFPGVKALDDVHFELRSGEVMALLERMAQVSLHASLCRERILLSVHQSSF